MIVLGSVRILGLGYWATSPAYPTWTAPLEATGPHTLYVELPNVKENGQVNVKENVEFPSLHPEESKIESSLWQLDSLLQEQSLEL